MWFYLALQSKLQLPLQQVLLAHNGENAYVLERQG